MTHGSLFSGIGGFDLAAEWMGWENKFHCEWNEFGQKVLHYYWPEAELFTDITKSDFTKYANKIDILTGGFPCQPYSQAGKRLGKEDDRHLWPEMLRAIREIKPSWVVGENVYGLVNWNGGLVFHEVQSDLEAEGYEVFPFLLPAASVGAPHKRDRIWFVAYSTSNREAQVGCGSTIENGRKASIFQKDEGWQSKAIQSIGLCNIQGDAADTSTRNTRKGKHTTQGSRECVAKKRKTENSRIVSGQSVCGNVERKRGNRGQDIQEISNATIAADTNGIGCDNGSNNREERYFSGDIGTTKKSKSKRKRWKRGVGQISSVHKSAADTNNKGLQGGQNINEWQEFDNKRGRNGFNIGTKCKNFSRYTSSNFQNFPTVSPICNGDDGLSNRLDSITFPKWRNESIKAGGNAIVPQVVYQIFKAIEQYEQQRPSNTTN